MSFNLNTKEHEKLDNFMGGVLDDFRADKLSRSQVIGIFAHVLTAAAIDNEAEVKAWLKPETMESYKKDAGIH